MEMSDINYLKDIVMGKMVKDLEDYIFNKGKNE